MDYRDDIMPDLIPVTPDKQKPEIERIGQIINTPIPEAEEDEAQPSDSIDKNPPRIKYH